MSRVITEDVGKFAGSILHMIAWDDRAISGIGGERRMRAGVNRGERSVRAIDRRLPRDRIPNRCGCIDRSDG
jgi:hypothetical protein